MSDMGYKAVLVDQTDPTIGQELIRVTYDDGRSEELRLHDYARLYSVPGLYEQIVHDRLACRSPQRLASMLAGAVDALGWDRGQVRVVDLAAGNGVSGAALWEQGLTPVLGTDILPEARAAALRDRPGIYDDYLTLDLLALAPGDQHTISALRANALCCVAPVGTALQQLPPPAFAAATRLLSDDALVVYMHDPLFGDEDEVTGQLRSAELGPDTHAELLSRTRYLHRRTVTGRPYEMDGVLWRLRRRAQAQ
jgi:hypothetical protein